MAGVRHRLLILPLALLAAACLAVSSTNQHGWLKQQDGILPSKPLPIALNFFRDNRGLKLQQEATALSETLEYMVWRDQQRNLRQQLLVNLQRQINRQPFKASLWENLLNLQSYIPDQKAQIGWTLQRAIHLTQWRTKSFIPLAYNCIYQKQHLSPQALSKCNVLLANSIDRAATWSLQHDLGMTREQIWRFQIELQETL